MISPFFLWIFTLLASFCLTFLLLPPLRRLSARLTSEKTSGKCCSPVGAVGIGLYSVLPLFVIGYRFLPALLLLGTVFLLTIFTLIKQPIRKKNQRTVYFVLMMSYLIPLISHQHLTFSMGRQMVELDGFSPFITAAWVFCVINMMKLLAGSDGLLAIGCAELSIFSALIAEIGGHGESCFALLLLSGSCVAYYCHHRLTGLPLGKTAPAILGLLYGIFSLDGILKSDGSAFPSTASPLSPELLFLPSLYLLFEGILILTVRAGQKHKLPLDAPRRNPLGEPLFRQLTAWCRQSRLTATLSVLTILGVFGIAGIAQAIGDITSSLIALLIGVSLRLAIGFATSVGRIPPDGLNENGITKRLPSVSDRNPLS